MKKLLISIFLFFLITSCWKNELWMNIEKNNENKTISWSVQTWSILEETNTWSIQESSNKKELIKEKDGNIYLFENWIKVETLTTKSTGQTECKIENDEFYVYTITNQNKNYWIVKREQYVCWAHYTWITYFWIDLQNNTELTELPIWWEIKTELEDNTIKITILYPETVVDKVEDARMEISKTDIISDWFIQKWNDWVKTIDLRDIIKPEIKKEEKTENNKVETSKIDNKYSHDNLIKNWYKLNNLWNIKEYYKFNKEDNYQSNGWDISKYNTVYIQWDKILEIIGSDSDTTTWFMSDITIFDWNKTKVIDEVEIWKFEYWFPIQPIFKKNNPKITIYEWLNKISIIDKEQWINKTIWER